MNGTTMKRPLVVIGALGGGVITCVANGAQKVAVATGFVHMFWPTKIATAKIEILGLE
jgi:hypothetical protein